MFHVEPNEERLCSAVKLSLRQYRSLLGLQNRHEFPPMDETDISAEELHDLLERDLVAREGKTLYLTRFGSYLLEALRQTLDDWDHAA